MTETSTEVRPQPGPQEEFLRSAADIAIYGGAAGGGKTWALLLEAMRHQANPDYPAVLFRRTYPQVTAPGGMWDRRMRHSPLAEPIVHGNDCTAFHTILACRIDYTLAASFPPHSACTPAGAPDHVLRIASKWPVPHGTWGTNSEFRISAPGTDRNRRHTGARTRIVPLPFLLGPGKGCSHPIAASDREQVDIQHMTRSPTTSTANITEHWGSHH